MSIRGRCFFVPGVVLLLSACGAPRYAACTTSMAEMPGVTYEFSAGDATNASPIFMSVAGRDPTPDDMKIRTRLIRSWVAEHAPIGATFSSWGSAKCAMERAGEFPGCDMLTVNLPSGEQMTFYFYAGNWYRG
jgi:hypothetical protein